MSVSVNYPRMSAFIAFQEYLVSLHQPMKQTWILVLLRLARELRRRLGLRLFNLDIIQEHGTEDRYYVIDINYFPGINGKSQVDEEDTEVLVITSKRKGKGMLFPKGGWETDELIESAALRETVEEAGVVGDVECTLGKWNIKNKNSNSSECHMFPLLVKEQLEFWPEKDARQRLWISVREARKVCQYWWMTEALEILVNRLKWINQESILQPISIW